MPAEDVGAVRRVARPPGRLAAVILTLSGALGAMVATLPWWAKLSAIAITSLLAPFVGSAFRVALAVLRHRSAQRAFFASAPTASLDSLSTGEHASVRGVVRVLEPVKSARRERSCGAFVARLRDARGGYRVVMKCGELEITVGSQLIRVDAGEWEVLDPLERWVDDGEARIEEGDEVVVAGVLEERAGGGMGGGYRDEAPRTYALVPPGRIGPASHTWRARRGRAGSLRWSLGVGAAVSGVYLLFALPAAMREPPPLTKSITVGRYERCDDVRQCDYGAYCVDGACTPTCYGDEQCPAGQVCVRTWVESHCATPAGEGEPCEETVCVEGLECRGNLRSFEDPSQPRASCKRPCRADTDCARGQWCTASPDAAGTCENPDDLPALLREVMAGARGEDDGDATAPEP